MWTIALSLVIAIVLLLYRSFIFMVLWNWFITKAFSVPPISLALALGVMIVINFLKGLIEIKAKVEGNMVIQLFVIVLLNILAGLVVLGVAWIVYQLV